jgi:hypothetical protein
MRYVFLLSLLLCVPLAQASSTPYDIPPGGQNTYIAPGEGPPTLNQQQGIVLIVSATYVAGNWVITLACSSSSTVDCEGTIET